jgi:hypothetical protein
LSLAVFPAAAQRRRATFVGPDFFTTEKSKEREQRNSEGAATFRAGESLSAKPNALYRDQKLCTEAKTRNAKPKR